MDVGVIFPLAVRTPAASLALDCTQSASQCLENVEAHTDSRPEAAFARRSKRSRMADGDVPPWPWYTAGGAVLESALSGAWLREQGLIKLHDRWLQLNHTH